MVTKVPIFFQRSCGIKVETWKEAPFLTIVFKYCFWTINHKTILWTHSKTNKFQSPYSRLLGLARNRKSVINLTEKWEAKESKSKPDFRLIQRPSVIPQSDLNCRPWLPKWFTLYWWAPYFWPASVSKEIYLIFKFVILKCSFSTILKRNHLLLREGM